MNKERNDCFVEMLSRHGDLSDAERSLLGDFDGEEFAVAADTIVHETGAPLDRFHVVADGWFYSYTTLSGDRRQIVQVHQSGDIVGMPDMAFGHATASVRAVTDGRLYPVPKAHLDAIFTDAPRLRALLLTIALRDQIVLTDRIRALGRMSPQERLAFFLLDILHRLRIADPQVGSRFRLPLNQEEIGDTLGLTNVTVSKTLMQMQLDGLIDRRDGMVTLNAIDDLTALCDFRNRNADVDLSWFSGS